MSLFDLEDHQKLSCVCLCLCLCVCVCAFVWSLIKALGVGVEGLLVVVSDYRTSCPATTGCLQLGVHVCEVLWSDALRLGRTFFH